MCCRVGSRLRMAIEVGFSSGNAGWDCVCTLLVSNMVWRELGSSLELVTDCDRRLVLGWRTIFRGCHPLVPQTRWKQKCGTTCLTTQQNGHAINPSTIHRNRQSINPKLLLNTALEFHDSEISRVETDGDTLTIRFSAAHVRGYGGRADADGGSGYAQPLAMQFSEAAWQGVVAECIGRLAGGKAVINSVTHSALELPCNCNGAISVELEFKNGAHLSVRAESVQCEFTGATQFVEDFRC